PRAGAAFIHLEPETGRTHQLRVQTASRGLPIAGDERYGDFEANRRLEKGIGLRRMFLHAYRIELRHPRTRHRLVFTAELTRALVDAGREDGAQPVDLLQVEVGQLELVAEVPGVHVEVRDDLEEDDGLADHAELPEDGLVELGARSPLLEEELALEEELGGLEI